MKRLTILIMLLTVLILPPLQSGTHAQSPETLDANTFWLRLRQYQALMELAITQDGASRVATIRQANALFADINSVRLDDGSIVLVEAAWLISPESTATSALQERHDRAAALLTYRQKVFGPSNADNRLDDLASILENERFQYDQQSASARSSSASQTRSSSSTGIPALLFEFVLYGIAVFAIIALLVYVLRLVNLSPAALSIEQATDDIPPTSSAATAQAEQSRAHNDYRAAIRYLYLASLLLLDERDVIRFDPSLTNFEHLAQTHAHPNTYGLLRTIVNVFEHVWYGFATVDEDMYQQFRQHIDQLKEATQSS